MTTKLSEHFTLEELTATNTGISNIPDELIVANLKTLCSTLEAVRSLLNKPIVVSSGYRNKEVNKAVGGILNSFHTYGLAADLKVVGMTPYEVCTLIKASSLSYDKLILEDLGGNGGWTHIQVQQDQAKNRREEYTIRKGTGYLSGIIDKT